LKDFPKLWQKIDSTNNAKNPELSNLKKELSTLTQTNLDPYLLYL